LINRVKSGVAKLQSIGHSTARSGASPTDKSDIMDSLVHM
jgi:hypothetical protein